MISLIIVVLFSLLILTVLLRFLGLAWGGILQDRLKIVGAEDDRLAVLAGEATASFYRRVVKRARKKERLKIEIMVGPMLRINKDDLKKYCDENGRLRNPADCVHVHALFKFWWECPDRVKLYRKAYNLYQEKHFAIGISSGVVFSEFHHGPDRISQGGYLFRSNDKVYKIKKKEFDTYIADEGFCTEITHKNYTEEIPKLTFKPELESEEGNLFRKIFRSGKAA